MIIFRTYHCLGKVFLQNFYGNRYTRVHVQMVKSDDEDFSFLDSYLPDIEQILTAMTESFSRKISSEFVLRVQFNIIATPQSWNLTAKSGGDVTVERGFNPRAEVILSVSEPVLQQIYKGKMTALTAGSKGTDDEKPLLDFKLGEMVEFTTNLKERLYFFLQHFFNRAEPEKIVLDEQHARKVHGGQAIPLYYHPGLRSAWYMVKKGEKINEDDETNQYHQSFTIISGEGFATIGQYNVRVKGGESYYIPPDQKHTIWTENDEPLVMIWLGWGEGA